MMTRISLSLLLMLFSFLMTANANNKSEVDKQTFLYSVKDNDSLWLDRYDYINPKAVVDDKQAKPCVMFMFGGGFASGTRDDKRYIPFLEFLAKEGYVVVSLDYRLGLKGFAPGKDSTPMSFAVAFVETIGIAVEDLYDATSYVCERAGEWGVDTKMIVAMGSSAGAISVLQGEHQHANQSLMSYSLPKGFRYAGVVAFAGAILDQKELSFDRNPCPIMMFHGDADANVPYGAIREMDAGFYGSEYIAGYLDAIDSPYWFWSQENCDHSLAVSPMDDNREDILSFLDKYVKKQQPLKIKTNINKIGAPVLNKQFGIMDYVKANFAP